MEELSKEELFLDGGDPTEETVVIEEIYQEVYEDVLKEYN